MAEQLATCHCEDAVNGEDNQVIVWWKHVATPAGERELVLDNTDCSGCSGDEAGPAIARHAIAQCCAMPNGGVTVTSKWQPLRVARVTRGEAHLPIRQLHRFGLPCHYLMLPLCDAPL